MINRCVLAFKKGKETTTINSSGNMEKKKDCHHALNVDLIK